MLHGTRMFYFVMSTTAHLCGFVKGRGLQPTFSSAKIGFAKGRMLAPFSPPKKGTHQQKKDKNSSHKQQKPKKSKKSNKQPPKKTLIQKLEFPSHLLRDFWIKNSSHPSWDAGEVRWCHDADGWSLEKAWEGRQNHLCSWESKGPRPQCLLRAWSFNDVLVRSYFLGRGGGIGGGWGPLWIPMMCWRVNLLLRCFWIKGGSVYSFRIIF